MKIIKLIVLISVLIQSINVNSQTRILEGHIVDGNLKPLANAIIEVNNYEKSVRSDEFGNFQIEIPMTVEELRSHFVGLYTETVNIKNKCRINIIMLEDHMIEFYNEKKELKFYNKRSRKLRRIHKKAVKFELLDKEETCI